MDNAEIKERLFEALLRVREQKQSLLFEGSALTRGEFFCLNRLCHHKRKHPESAGLYSSELAEHLHILPPAVSRILRRLEEKGFISRNIDPADRRNIFVTVTEAGEACWQGTADRLEHFTNRLFLEMGEEDLWELVALLERLADLSQTILQEEGIC